MKERPILFSRPMARSAAKRKNKAEGGPIPFPRIGGM